MTPEDLKSLFKSYRQTTETFEGSSVQKSIKNLFSETAKIKLCHPFGTLKAVSYTHLTLPTKRIV